MPRPVGKRIRKPAHLASSLPLTAPVQGTTGIELDLLRKDFAEFLQSERDIPSVLVAGRTSDMASVALMWVIPSVGDSTERGNLLALEHSTVTFHNDGPFDLFIDPARPLGFKDDPVSIAHWESLSKAPELRIAAGGSRKVTVKHYYNNDVVPCLSLAGDSDCVHVMSYAVCRSKLSRSGEQGSQLDNAVALRVQVETFYRSDGDNSGVKTCFHVRAYTTAAHMKTVNCPPSPAVSLGALRNEYGQITSVQIDAAQLCIRGTDGKYVAQKGYLELGTLLFKAGGKASERVDGLDTTQVYALSSALPAQSLRRVQFSWGAMKSGGGCLSAAQYIRWFDGEFRPDPAAYPTYSYPIRGWVLCASAGVGLPKLTDVCFFNAREFHASGAAGMFADSLGELDASLDLHPLRRTARVTKAVRAKTQLHLVRAPSKVVSRDVLYKTMLDESFLDKALQAASVIVRVMKTVLAVASVVGLAETLDAQRLSSSDHCEEGEQASETEAH